MAASRQAISSSKDEYPRAADLLAMMADRPLPLIGPEILETINADQAPAHAKQVLDEFNRALASNDVGRLASCFFEKQCYWRDQLALTWHLRTIESPRNCAASISETTALRGVPAGFTIKGAPQFIPAAPTLQFINCEFTFTTSSPAASCRGSIKLLPVRLNGSIAWRIWILSTWMEDLHVHPENTALLDLPRRNLDNLDQIETDVFIIGGGNAAVALAARLKTLGVESIIAEQNAQIGDNWLLRYDSLRFHVPTSFCEMPYMNYDESLQTPHQLSKDDLGNHLRKYAESFNLNTMTSVKQFSTTYNSKDEVWTISFETPSGRRRVKCKHVVQATGFSSQIPYVPNIPGREFYRGRELHSARYKNPKQLQDQEGKSVLVVGSANTAFDVITDCYNAGLQTTMVARSPTYLCPVEYICDHRSLGVYDPLGVEAADHLLMTGPAPVDAILSSAFFTSQAAEEPERYTALAKAGFQVIDSRDPKAVLMSNLLERAGGHYVDVGASKLIAEGKVAVKGGAEPVAYTERGLRFSDGTSIDADAIIWCTGFKDGNARDTAAEILGGDRSPVNEKFKGDHILLPRDIAARLDATWGIDSEGEVRGMWKRHLRMNNYWVMGGYTQQHRWHSRTLALQIKAAVEGILPPAYRQMAGKITETAL
ncbi:hypothetical protein PFICI_00095 [Pestalotiopsis fici W106-1]|uniref:FAD/NAD(P)-binding domain-containing protein n=1 Tax=Pestalotiopsis fici (strain W106-1 / CGMCC3.15140) TaxID=1229662 RepID=W3XLD9_PESFW|nr:uncharacterized protein PFICI_00095 [Pestalotiopsis fici W106-1]ETS86267.1 hypothetical protein PFICI_00095 [Pestalotiopsis fici W106-1]